MSHSYLSGADRNDIEIFLMNLLNYFIYIQASYLKSERVATEPDPTRQMFFMSEPTLS